MARSFRCQQRPGASHTGTNPSRLLTVYVYPAWCQTTTACSAYLAGAHVRLLDLINRLLRRVAGPFLPFSSSEAGLVGADGGFSTKPFLAAKTAQLRN